MMFYIQAANLAIGLRYKGANAQKKGAAAGMALLK
jgi:hypothetical protein